MKILTAGISIVTVMLLTGAVQAQTMTPGAPRAVARPPVVRPPAPGTHPSHVRPPFFRHHHFFGSGLIVTPVVEAPQAYVYSYPHPVYLQYPGYAQSQQEYWAYCRNPQGYYPYVSECRDGWLPVPATTPPPPFGPGQPVNAASGGVTSVEELRERIARSRAD